MKVANVDQKLSIAVAILAVFGYTLGYGGLYLFHFVVALWIIYAIFSKGYISKVSLSYTIPLQFLLVFSVFSLLWTVDFLIGMRYIFYLFCGMACVMAVLNNTDNIDSFNKFCHCILAFCILNFVIGFLETLGILRLPMSPYSTYIQYFGYSVNENFIESNKDSFLPFLEKPSGFNYNFNTFGFVYIMFFPFLFFLFQGVKRYFFVFLLIWFFLVLGSKGFLLGILGFLALLSMNYKAKAFIFLPIAALFVVSLAFMGILNIESLSENRAATLFTEVNRGIDLISSGQVEEIDSTTIRVALYLKAISLLTESYGLGAGIGGVGATLIQENFSIQSLHWTFLEMLSDLGVIPFVILMSCYVWLIRRMFVIAKKHPHKQFSLIAKSCGYSLFIIPFASISPSSIIYILAFWLVLGISIGVLKLGSK